MDNLVDDVQHPIRAIKTLYAARSADSSDDFGVGKHFTDLVASGAKVSSHENSKFARETHLTDAVFNYF